MESTGDGEGARVLLLPFPGAQGHTNPLLELGRRLARHGLRPTLVTTRHVLSSAAPPGAPFRVAAISDGLDAGGAASDYTDYFSRLEAVGSETLRELLLSEARAGRPVRVLVYDSHLPWAGRVAHAAGVPTAAFFSQPCSVNVVYGELSAGRLALPVTDGLELFARGALGVELGPEDVPPFAAAPESQPAFLKTAIGQFDGLEDADDVLVNSFNAIEPTVSPLPVLHSLNGFANLELLSSSLDGERKGEYKRNAMKWMQKAKEAMQEGGSSDKHIAEFAAKYLSI